jgi:hypothetical protein
MSTGRLPEINSRSTTPKLNTSLLSVSFPDMAYLQKSGLILTPAICSGRVLIGQLACIEGNNSDMVDMNKGQNSQLELPALDGLLFIEENIDAPLMIAPWEDEQRGRMGSLKGRVADSLMLLTARKNAPFNSVPSRRLIAKHSSSDGTRTSSIGKMRNEDLLRRQVPKSAHDSCCHMRVLLFRKLRKAKISNLKKRGGRHYK